MKKRVKKPIPEAKPKVEWKVGAVSPTPQKIHFGSGDLLVTGSGNCLRIGRTPAKLEIGSTPHVGMESVTVMEWYFSNPRSALVVARALVTIALNYDGQSELFLAG